MVEQTIQLELLREVVVAVVIAILPAALAQLVALS
jgi:hypothetical protein